MPPASRETERGAHATCAASGRAQESAAEAQARGCGGDLARREENLLRGRVVTADVRVRATVRARRRETGVRVARRAQNIIHECYYQRDHDPSEVARST